MKEVLILQHAACEAPGLIGQAIEASGGALKPIQTFAGEAVSEEIGDAAGLVIMGGPMGVYEHERYPFIRRELRLIEDALRRSKPVLGVCLGSQLLASALGAKVQKGAKKEIGGHGVILSEAAREDPLLRGLGREFTACHWHGDIFNLPTGAVGLASSVLTACQAFRYETSAYGFLFHMEMTAEILRCMTRTFKAELDEEGLSGQAILKDSEGYLPALSDLGRQVFLRWASMLRDC